MNIPDIKSSLPILSVLRYFGIVPDKNGMISCPDPHHDDKHPSCKIYEKTNTFFCFSCGAKGDQIQLIEFLQNQGKHRAILTAKEILGHVPPMKNNKTHHIMDTLSTTQLKETLRLFFEKAATSYKKSANAQGYCTKRNIDGHKLGLGFVGITFFRHYTDKQRDMAIKAGLLKKHREGSFKSKFTNCIIFPLYNTDGEIIYIYGRSISGSDKFKHVLLGNSYAGIFPSFPSGTIKRIILTEGFGDCATLLSHFDKIPLKDTAVIPLFSAVGGFTDEIKQAISGKCITEVIQFYDGDSTGKTALEKNMETIRVLNKTTCISAIEVPEGEDVNSLLGGHSAEIYTELINKRKTIHDPLPNLVRDGENEQTNTPTVTQGKLNLVANGEAKHVTVDDKSCEKKSLAPPEPEPGLPYFDTENPDKLIYKTKTAEYIIKGDISKDLNQLKATLEIKPPRGKRTKYCRPDFYDDKILEKTARETAEKFNLPEHLVEDDLFELRYLLEAYRDQLEAEKKDKKPPKKKKHPVPPEKEDECLKFWQRKNLYREIFYFLGQAGITGEERARMLVFCIATSAGMFKALHGIIKGNSGRGKTYLMSKICELVPPEIYIGLTTLTDKSLFYSEMYDYKDCLMSIEDKSIMTEEMNLYFRELQSKEKIGRKVPVPNKDGLLKTRDQWIIGPMATLVCTTEEEILVDDENRCFIIPVDESGEQKRRIIDYQGKKAAGLIDKAEIVRNIEFMQNCIRMLEPYEVHNPYGNRIQLPPFVRDEVRLFSMFLGLIDQVTILHQFQCEKTDDGRLIATTKYIRLAIETMFDAIVVKADDISDNVRKTFESMKKHVKQLGGEKYESYKFKVKEIRLGLNMRRTTLDDHIRYLNEAEYIIRDSGTENKGFWYKIAHWDDYISMRERIKNFMYKQIEEIEKEEQEQQKNKNQVSGRQWPK